MLVMDYVFIYTRLSGLTIKMSARLTKDTDLMRDLWCAAEMALWQAQIDPTSNYSALVYTIMWREMIDLMRRHKRSFINTVSNFDESQVVNSYDFGHNIKKKLK